MARLPSPLLVGLLVGLPVGLLVGLIAPPAGAAASGPAQEEVPAQAEGPAPAQEEASPPPVALLTMGPDPTVIFRKWGHAALCVGERCLNYGVTDFSRPVGLVLDVLRGRARFWVAVSSLEDTVADYAWAGRSVFRQELELPPAAREALLVRIAHDLVPGQSEYVYDHFDDNCTTRIRDYLNDAGSGRLREPLALGPPFAEPEREPTFRSHIRRGLHGEPLLLWLTDVGVGSAVDEPISSFDAMFLPGALRHGVERGLGSPPERLHDGRYGDLLPADPGSGPYLPWLFAVAGLLAALILLPATGRFGAGAAAALLTAVGALAAFVLLVSPLPELRSSLAAFALPVSDALLATRQARWYGPLRLAWGGLFLLLILAGLVHQPLGWTVAAALLPVAAIVWRDRRRRQQHAQRAAA